jgi:hypothetical protein
MERALLGIGSAAVLLLASPTQAVSPTRTPFVVDFTFPSDLLTPACGVPVLAHFEGSGIGVLHYDRTGTQIIREFDQFPRGFTVTFSSPVAEGGTGKSFTYVQRASYTFLYPEGVELGASAVVIVNGVQQATGPGGARIVGHEVDEGIIVDFTPEGVPIVEPTALVSQAGRFDDFDAIVQAWCAALTDP